MLVCSICFTTQCLRQMIYSKQTVVVETHVFALVTFSALSLHVPPGSSALRSPTKSCRALASLTHRVSCLEKNNVLAEVSSFNAFSLVLFKCSDLHLHLWSRHDLMIMWPDVLVKRSQLKYT